MQFGRKLRGVQKREEERKGVRREKRRYRGGGKEKVEKALEPRKKYLENETILTEEMFSGGFEDIESCYSSDDT